MDFEARNRAIRADFWFTIGSSESGQSSGSAERLNNNACNNGLMVRYFSWGG